MDRNEMLNLLDIEGASAESDYNDGDGIEGWFGWGVTESLLLVVTYKPCTEDGRPGDAQTAAWRLTPVEKT